MLNDWAVPKMSDLGTKCAGHEGSGVIVKVGDQVKNLKPGMRAGFKVSISAAQQPKSCVQLQDLMCRSRSRILVVYASFAATATSATAQRLS